MSAHKKSRELHALTGTTPQNNVDFVTTPGKVRCPAYLSSEARKIFRQIAATLQERRTLTSGDTAAIALYAETEERRRQAAELVRREGPVIQVERLDNNGHSVVTTRCHPATKVVEAAERTLLSILKELGLTSQARSKVAPTSEAGPRDPFADFLNRRPGHHQKEEEYEQ